MPALEAVDKARVGAKQAFDAVRREIVVRQLQTMEVGRLREVTEGRLNLGPIVNAGVSTVAAVLTAGPARLRGVPGVGEQTATRAVAAARQVEAALGQGVRVRFDPDSPSASQTRLLAALAVYGCARQTTGPLRRDLHGLVIHINALITRADRASSRVGMLFAGSARRVDALDALGRLAALVGAPQALALVSQAGAALQAVSASGRDSRALWADYERRAVVYNGLLIEIGGLAPDAEAAQGFVPAAVAERVHRHPLDTSALRVSLRGYQAFGAKFALAQGRAILGDEMGLGKTIEALAAMAHLHAEGDRHFLVVCPAGVLVNWTHEVRRHSSLRAFRLHGPDREQNLKVWARQGGVGITTYDSLKALPKPDGFEVALLVVDEAHYVKNPDALRTRAVRGWIGGTPRALFLTGTPMENKVEEFRTLVGHLQPAVAAGISARPGLAGAAAFRTAVAPVYLRRNQADVLAELPPRIVTEEWVELTGADLHAYREAVASRNFMAMRRAAYTPKDVTGSAKLARLVDVVSEVTANGRKVVVFSYFLDVLDSVQRVLGDLALGPVTGSVPPPVRQELVDHFTARPGPVVLVSQIEAGGVGVNLQAASVVILTEPQWKSTVEDQAIARCHRMGQVRPVNVHRLLAANTVDQRMLEVLARKTLLFDEYVRHSELKEASPDAVDVSDVSVARDVVSQVEEERRIVELERRRLGIGPLPV